MTPPKRFLRWAGLAVGIGLFAWVLSSSDLKAVGAMLRQVHWRFLLVLAFYGVIFGLDTLGWRFALRPSAKIRVPLDRLFRTRLAGEAVNYVTPAVSIGGEPVKALLLFRRFGIPMAEGMASVVVAKTTFAFSMLLFAGVGLAVAAATHPLPAPLVKWVGSVLGGLLLLLALFVGAQFLQPFRRFFKRRGWDREIRSLYLQSPRSVFWSFGFHFLGWLAGALEVYLILHFLKIPVSFSTAFSLEALWVLLRSGAFMIPASLGASEGILLFVCSGLGVSAVAGLALGLVRRARELAWTGLGLLEFSREA